MITEPRVTVVGAGFVGLATGTFLADCGVQVAVLEQNRVLIPSLQKGQLHFNEPTLARHFRAAVKQGRLTVDEPCAEAYRDSSLIIIAIDSVDSATWRMRTSVFRRLAQLIGASRRRRPCLVALKSTNVVGFGQQFRAELGQTAYGRAVQLAVNPEFLREGFAYEDTAEPSRVVVGAEDSRSRQRMVRFYRSVYGKSVPIVATDMKSAELIKLASNLYLAHRLTFVNEVAERARAEGLEVDTVIDAVGLDPRIGQGYFRPGLGFGGSCLPKDCRLIDVGQPGFGTARTALAVNRAVLTRICQSLAGALGTLRKRRLALLGIAFKPESDDTRGSQAAHLLVMLRRRGASVRVYDPFVAENLISVAGNIDKYDDITETLRGAQAVIIGAAHQRFTDLRPQMVARLVRRRLVCDRFGILDRRRWERAGFEFI